MNIEYVPIYTIKMRIFCRYFSILCLMPYLEIFVLKIPMCDVTKTPNCDKLLNIAHIFKKGRP